MADLCESQQGTSASEMTAAIVATLKCIVVPFEIETTTAQLITSTVSYMPEKHKSYDTPSSCVLPCLTLLLRVLSISLTQATALVGGRSTRLDSGQLVAVKALNLRGRGFDWKQLQLLEREAAAIKSMRHPGVPRFIEYFEVDTESDRVFFLVQVG